MAHTQGDTWERRQLILQCTIWMCASPFENHHSSMATDDGDKRGLATSPRCAFLKEKEKSLEWWLQSHCFSLVGVWGGSLLDYLPPLFVDTPEHGLPCWWMTFLVMGTPGGGLPCGWLLLLMGSLVVELYLAWAPLLVFLHSSVLSSDTQPQLFFFFSSTHRNHQTDFLHKLQVWNYYSI